jgi:predicted phage baseplate assembly protein
VGTHATFLETMVARLSSPDYPELNGLKTRLPSDAAIAFLDAWATVADVLTFYQERIANEGYLRTATERRSILELARLVGYRLRPGVAASVFLAYTLEKDQTVEIAPGNRVQSLPGPGELPQSFETSEKLEARSAWNELKPRLTRPQRLQLDTARKKLTSDTLYLQGISTNLKPNDPLLFVIGEANNQQVLHRVESVELQPVENRTRIKLQKVQESRQLVSERSIVRADERFSEPINPRLGSTSSTTSCEDPVSELCELSAAVPKLDRLVAPLTKPPSQQPKNALRLSRDVATTFACEADTAPRLLTALQPDLSAALYRAWQSVTVSHSEEQPEVKVYALRTRASVFGHNALKRTVIDGELVNPPQEWDFNGSNPAPALQDFQLIVSLTPGSGSVIEVVGVTSGGASSASPMWLMSTNLTIDNQTLTDPNHQLPAQGQSFTVTQNGISLNVTVVESSSSEFLPLILDFVLPDRNINVRLSIDPEQQLQISSIGNQPICIDSTVSQPSLPTPSPGILFNISSGEPTNSVTITVNGSVSETADRTEIGDVIWLDTSYGQILPQSWVVIERPEPLNSTIPQQIISQVKAVSDRSRNEYNLPVKATRIELQNHQWLDPNRETFRIVRETAVFAQSEELKLAAGPITPVEAEKQNPIQENEIELAELYRGLEAGRWMIVSGERTDLPDGTSGVRASELVMLAGVDQRVDPTLPGDQPHTFLRLAQPLAYQYKRDTVTVYGNVVKATHGETRREVLGSGNASQELQSFRLQQFPVTYLAAPTPAGSASTLEVRVNDILWRETETLADLEKDDRKFITQTDDQGKTTVIFGNGRQGARPPSGIENIKALYRTGIGKPGNVKAEQLSLLATRPLGVKSVINPLPATGGADAESRDQARRNVPLALMALDRLVSVKDYADFTRTFAGIGKASATRLSDSQRQLVHLTIAGADDIPIDQNSDLYQNFLQALKQSGDPNQPVQVELRELLLLVIEANVKIHPDYLWESVVTQIRTALLETFSFEQRQLGQPAYLSEVIRTIQQIPGVDYVDVDTFGGIPEKEVDPNNPKKRRVLPPSEIVKRLDQLKNGEPASFVAVNLAGNQDGSIHPAQLAYLTPAVPDTLILNRI